MKNYKLIFYLVSLFITLGFSKPNIILFYADDMSSGDVSGYSSFGEKIINTPTLDRMIDNGIRFTDAHSSSAVCTPSRYSILTGVYSWRTALEV